MTTNLDRAAEIITPWIEKEWGYPEDNAESAASALSDAGLLAPEDNDEVVRLRRELEQLRDMYDSLATGDCAVANQHRNSRDAITRILEGGNDE